MSLDPITYSLLRNAFLAVTREMFTVFKRTAMLPVIYESNDFGMSLYDDRLNLIADAPGLPVFLGSLDFAIEATIAELGGEENLRPGDVLLNNHPFLTGGQPPDAAIIQPIFHEEKLIGYTALRAHMGDLGAKGAYPTDSTNLYQEGLILPAVKLYDEGRLNNIVLDILKANSRMPIETAGCVLAAAGAVQKGAAKVVELVETYGRDTYYETIDRSLAESERAVREAIEAIADGVYPFEDLLDDNGVDRHPVKIAGTVTIAGSDITIDLSDSAPEQGGPINSPWPYTVTVCRFALKVLTTPSLAPTSGEYAPLTVIAPKGSMFNPVPPAPTFIGFATGYRLNDLIIEAVGPATPQGIPAANGGDPPFLVSLIERPDKGRFEFFFDMGALGHGATATSDGMNALFHPLEAGGALAPAEVMENRMPIVVWRAELNQDSAGAGRFRGGLSGTGEFELLSNGSTSAAAEKTRAAKPTYGRDGGEGPPFLSSITLLVGTDVEIKCGKRSDIQMTAGDRITNRAAGGAGWGNPLEREVERVALDVRDEYVSVQNARDSYGVVVDPVTRKVDQDATLQLRQRLRSERDTA